MPFKSRQQQKFMFAAANRGEIPMATVKEWAAETKKQPGGFKALPTKVSDKDQAEAEAKTAAFMALLRECGQQPVIPEIGVLKFAFNQMVAPVIRGQGMPPFSGITGSMPMKMPQQQQQAVPARPQAQVQQPKTLGGNTPSTNPIGLMGALPTATGSITGNAAFSGPKIKAM